MQSVTVIPTNTFTTIRTVKKCFGGRRLISYVHERIGKFTEVTDPAGMAMHYEYDLIWMKILEGKLNLKIKYDSFTDENEIINKVRKDKEKIVDLFGKKLTLQEVINTAIGPNTYRIFRSNGMIRPSNMFRKWAFSVLGKENEIKLKLCVEAKEDFNISFDFLSNNLLQVWNNELSGMTIFRSRKMIALLLKNFCFWDKFSDVEFQNYVYRIPIPLDSRTISAIRLSYNKNGKYKIPVNVTMGFIDEEEKYIDLQKYFQYLASKAQVPVVFFDYLYDDFII